MENQSTIETKFRSVNTIWSDIHDTVALDRHGNIKLVTNIDAVIVSMQNILGTIPGERVMRPNFGSVAHQLLFEGASQAIIDIASSRLKTDIESWEPRVSVISTGFEIFPNQNLIKIHITFTVKGYATVFNHPLELRLGE